MKGGSFFAAWGLALGVIACAQSPAEPRAAEAERVTPAMPAELAIMPVVLYSGDAADLGAMREALATESIDRGFTALSRRYVDQAGIDPDVPALGEAGVLRLRLREWTEATLPSPRIRGECHLTLYRQGKVLVDEQIEVDLRPDAAESSANAEQQLKTLRARCAADLLRLLPAPPAIVTL